MNDYIEIKKDGSKRYFKAENMDSAIHHVLNYNRISIIRKEYEEDWDNKGD